MKNFLLLLSIIFSNYCIGQDISQLKLTPMGVEAIIVEVDSLSAPELYNKALNWVKETYKNPEKVLKAEILNDKIRLDGFANDAWWYKTLGIRSSYNMEYTVEIAFKDGRYKFQYFIGQFYVDGGQQALFDYKTFYKKNGEVKKTYSDAVPSLEITMNELSKSFYNYVTGKTSEKDSDW